MPVCVLYLLFSHNSMFIQGGEEDGELYQGDLKLTGAGDFWGGARGYQGALELTDNFGISLAG